MSETDFKLKLWPWEHDEKPYWINPDNGLEWFVDKFLTEECSRERVNNWPVLNAVCFIVVENTDGKREPITRILIDKKTNGIIADKTSLAAMGSWIDMLRVSAMYEEAEN